MILDDYLRMNLGKFSKFFHRNNYGFCMLDKPKKDMIEPASRRLAGEKFSADEQCKLVFGPESKVCSYMVTISI